MGKYIGFSHRKFIQEKDTNIPDCELRPPQYIRYILNLSSCAAPKMAPITEGYASFLKSFILFA